MPPQKVHQSLGNYTIKRLKQLANHCTISIPKNATKTQLLKLLNTSRLCTILSTQNVDDQHVRNIVTAKPQPLIQSSIVHKPEVLTLYFAQYKIVKKLTGGLSGDIVYKVKCRTTNQFSLIKLLQKATSVFKECKMQVLNKSISPIIYECFVTAPMLFKGIILNGVIRMEYLDGYKTIHELKHVTPRHKRDICKIVQQMHNNGVIHTDLHAKNIMTNGTTYKIIDYGHAIFVGQSFTKWLYGSTGTNYEKTCLQYNAIQQHNAISYKSLSVKKPTVLVLDVGTFCDFALMDTARKELAKTYNVINISNNHKCNFCNIHFRIAFPHIGNIVKQGGTKLGIFQSQTKAQQVGTILKNVSLVGKFHRVTGYVRTLINTILDMYSIKHIVSHIAQLYSLFHSNYRFDIPTTCLHFTPGYLPNSKYMNVFANPTLVFNPRTTSRRTKKQWYIMNLISSVKQPAKHIHHVLYYDEPLLKREHFRHKLQITRLGSMLPMLGNPELPPKVQRFLTKHKTKRKLFMTFGSFVQPFEQHGFLKLLLHILDQLPDVCVIFLGKSKQVVASNRVLSFDGYLSYLRIVPRCDVVMFTGSICLQNIAWKYATPMIFIPHLNEQYFWAKNYERLTNIPYIDKRQKQPIIMSQLHDMIHQRRLSHRIQLYKPHTRQLTSSMASWQKTHHTIPRQFKKQKKSCTPSKSCFV